MALYQKYNGEYGDVVLTNVDLEQKNYLRVVFKKTSGENTLRDNVNAMLETFAKIKTDDKCIITTLAEKYKFGSYEKTVADYIITDFDGDNGAEGGGSESAGTEGGNELTGSENPPTTPENGNGGANSNGNTSDFPSGWGNEIV